MDQEVYEKGLLTTALTSVTAIIMFLGRRWVRKQSIDELITKGLFDATEKIREMQEQRIRELEDRLESERAICERRIDSMQVEMRQQRDKSEDEIQNLKSMLSAAQARLGNLERNQG